MKNVKQIRELNKDELYSLYNSCLKKLFNLKVRSSDEGFKPHEFKLYKKTIARVLTVLNNSGEKNGAK